MDKFDYQLEVIKWELNDIESSIRKMDDLENSTKKWAIVTWIGALAVLLKDKNLHEHIYISAFLPLLFLMADAHWRKLQRRFIYRLNKISNFINSKEFDQAFANRDLQNFKILDPISRLDKGFDELKEYTSLKRILCYPTVFLIYAGQVLLSLMIYVLIN